MNTKKQKETKEEERVSMNLINEKAKLTKEEYNALTKVLKNMNTKKQKEIKKEEQAVMNPINEKVKLTKDERFAFMCCQHVLEKVTKAVASLEKLSQKTIDKILTSITKELGAISNNDIKELKNTFNTLEENLKVAKEESKKVLKFKDRDKSDAKEFTSALGNENILNSNAWSNKSDEDIFKKDKEILESLKKTTNKKLKENYEKCREDLGLTEEKPKSKTRTKKKTTTKKATKKTK